MPRAIIVAVVGLLVLGTAACSGGSAHSSGPAVLGKAFYTRAVAVCEKALAEKRAQPPFPFPNFNPTRPDLSKLPTIGRYEDRGLQIFNTWLRQMLKLGQPPRGQAEWAALLRPLRRHTRIIAEQQAAAARSDGTTFTKDYYEGNKAQDQMVHAADAAGVPVCATAAGA